MDYKTQIFNINSSTVLKNITKDSINYILYNIFQETKFNFLVDIVDNNFEIEAIKKEIKFYNKDIQILVFPEWNTMPYDVNSPQLKIQTDRIETLYKLMNYNNLYSKEKILLLISKNAIVQKIINKKDFRYIKLSINQQIPVDEIKQLLEENCYNLKDTSITLGDYSINNKTVDLITFDNKCYRIFIDDNKIQNIKSFDPETQISFDTHDNIFALPIREVLFNKNNIQTFKQNYRNIFGTPRDNDFLYKNISNNTFYNGFENWMPLFYANQLETIFDYIPENAVITYTSNLNENLNKCFDQIDKYYNLRLLDLEHKENKEIYNPIKTNTLYLSKDSLKSSINKYINIIFDINNSIKNSREMELNIHSVPNFFKESKEVFSILDEFLIQKEK